MVKKADDLYETEPKSTFLQVEPQGTQAEVLEDLRKRLADAFGVTLQGQFITVRWGTPMRQVTMVVTDVDDDAPPRRHIPQ